MEILHAEHDLVVCVKPVGLDSESEVPKALQAALGGEIFPLHRLDKNVGGVMVYARTKSAAAALSAAIQSGKMVKEYVAKVHGTPPQSGILTDFLFKDSRKNKVFVVKKARAGVKEAKLQYRLLEPGTESLVHVRLFTGRSHQIRVQFSSRGFPLVGDHKYGSRSKETAPMLFSCRIRFPYKERTYCFTAMPDWAADIRLEEWACTEN